MGVHVQIEFLFGEDRFVSEAELPTVLADPGVVKPAIDACFGGLVITHGATSFKLFDEVSWVITTVAFETLPELVRTGGATFFFWGAEGSLHFRRDGEELEISSPHIQAARFPLEPFLSGTADAADRFLDLVNTHWPEEEVFDRPGLRAQAQAARSCIATTMSADRSGE